MHELSEADRRLNVESAILSIVSSYGGERLVADNPAMPRLVTDLADMFEALVADGRFLRPKEAPDAA